jgi:hypothetical protein
MIATANFLWRTFAATSKPTQRVISKHLLAAGWLICHWCQRFPMLSVQRRSFGPLRWTFSSRYPSAFAQNSSPSYSTRRQLERLITHQSAHRQVPGLKHRRSSYLPVLRFPLPRL